MKDDSTNADILTGLLGSRTRGCVLTLLLQEPGTRLHLREIARRCDVGTSSVQRELSRLERLGLVRSEREGSNRFFAAANHPIEPELRALLKAAGTRIPAEGAQVTTIPAQIAALVNPRIRPALPAIEESCRRHRVSRVAVFGSATQPETGIEPRDVDLLVTFEPLAPAERSEEYFALLEELEAILGMPVDIVVSTSVRNPYLRDELDRTQVVLYEAA